MTLWPAHCEALQDTFSEGCIRLLLLQLLVQNVQHEARFDETAQGELKVTIPQYLQEARCLPQHGAANGPRCPDGFKTLYEVV